MGAIIAAIAAFLAEKVTSEIAIAFIWKAFLTLLLYIALPLVLYNLQVYILKEVMTYAMDKLSTTLPTTGVVYQASGVAAWFLIKLRIPETLMLILAALNTRMTIALLPKVGKIYS